MKTLKFKSELAEMITRGEKNCTWRIFDEKELAVDENILMINSQTGEEFAKAKIVSVSEKTFADLAENDMLGHEKFSSKQEMLKTYGQYYNCDINLNTRLKVIKFELIKIL